MKKKYPVIFTETEREHLKSLIAAGTAPARKLTHARILLKADQSLEGPGWVDEQVAEAVEVSQPTVSRVRKQYVEEGLEAALNRRAPNREYHRKLNGEQEARLIALACSDPPKGRLAGVCGFWPTGWLSLRLWMISPTRRLRAERGGPRAQGDQRLAVLSEWEGNTQRATDHLHEARALAQKIGDEELREGFLAAPQVRRVLVRD
jgi:DNA-binding transcriptional ArsR family regulator